MVYDATMISPGEPPMDFDPLPWDIVETSIPSIFEQMVEKYPHNIAVRDRGSEISYRGLNDAANALSHIIIERCGRGKEPIVFVLGHEAKGLIALLAILKSGRPYLPVNADYPPERMNLILSESNSPLILTDEIHAALVEAALGDLHITILNMDAVAAGPDHGNPGIQIDPGDVACILYTSGSTGTPKGVVMTHRLIIFQVLTDINAIHCSPSDRHVLLSQLGFTASRSPVYESLLVGGTVCVYDVRSLGVAGLANWLATEGITILCIMAPVFRFVFSDLPATVILPSLRLVWLSGDVVYASDVELYRTHTLPHCIFRNSLASSEAGLVAMNLFGHDAILNGEIVPIGHPIPGKEINLVGDGGQPVANGEAGEIVVRSRFMSSGYWNSPELTEEKFQRDPNDPELQTYHTGDLGRWNKEGMLEHLGRVDNQVKIRGYRVDMSEIEGVLRKHPDIRNVTVVKSSGKSGVVDRLVGYIVPRMNVAIPREDLRTYLGAQLPDFMIPSFFVFLDGLPLNANGKVDKEALPAVSLDREISASDLPANDVEAQLLDIWKRSLGLEQVSVLDEFFSIGGDSLMAARMFTHIERAFGRSLPLHFLLEYGTIRRLADLLQGSAGREFGHLVPIRAEGTRPPLFIVPGGGSDVIGLLDLVRALGEEQPVYGLQDIMAGSGRSIYFDGLPKAAAEFIRAIKMVRLSGPYHLAGHSFGGLVAFEMARQLSLMGEAVGLLGILDSFPPQRGRRSGALKNRFQTHLKNLGERGMSGKIDYIFERFKLFLNRLGGRNPFRRLYDFRMVQRMIGPDPMRPVRVALAGYTPAPYEGRAVIYRATERPFAVTWDMTAPWAEFILGGIEFHNIPSEHKSIIKQPHAGTLAEFMKRDLELFDQDRASDN